MKINEINEFQIRDTIEEPDVTPNILLENMQSKKQVKVLGKILEAQYRIEDHFLLIVTEGNPFEEALYIYFLNNNLQRIDSLELSVTYTEGILRNVSVVEPDKIHFSFFENDDKWILKILSRPAYSIFSRKYPVKRKMSFLHKSWLILKKS